MKHSLQEYFEILRENLSVRAIHILETNNIYDSGTLLEKSKDPRFAFINLRNCGKKTAEELDRFLRQMLRYQKESTDINTTVNSVASIDIRQNGNDIAVKLKIPIESLRFSPRTINILKRVGVVTMADLVSFNKVDILKLQGLGKRSFQEIESTVISYGLRFGMNTSAYIKEYDVKKSAADPLLVSLRFICAFSEEDIKFSSAFKDKYCHFPMAFLLYKYLGMLPEYERDVLRLTWGMCSYSIPSTNIALLDCSKWSVDAIPPMTLDKVAIKFNLTRERIRQIYEKANKRIKTDETFKQLSQHKNWEVYGLGRNDLFLYSHNLNVTQILNEHNYLIEFIQKNYNTDWIYQFVKDVPYLSETSVNFIFLSRGMTPFWLDQEKRELSMHCCTTSPIAPYFFTNKRFSLYNFIRAVKEVRRLQKVKKSENVLIPIVSYFIDNSTYWNNNTKLETYEIKKLKGLLIDIFCNLFNINMEGDNLLFKPNKVDYGELLYHLLKKSGTRMHREELFVQLKKHCNDNGFPFDFIDSQQVATILSKDSRIIPIGKSSYWGLKERGEDVGSIREISVQIVKSLKQPIHINELTKLVMDKRPDSNEKSISSVIRQTTASGELLLFYYDYIGYPENKYEKEYIVMPQSFNDWLLAFKNYVLKNKRLPYCNQVGFDGYLYRWYYRARQLTGLTSDEILKLDALDKELSHYPHNAKEYDFLQNCNMYKCFVENNKRMLTKEDDLELFRWFYASSRNYSTFNDNRYSYFSDLLQALSSILY